MLSDTTRFPHYSQYGGIGTGTEFKKTGRVGDTRTNNMSYTFIYCIIDCRDYKYMCNSKAFILQCCFLFISWFILRVEYHNATIYWVWRGMTTFYSNLLYGAFKYASATARNAAEEACCNRHSSYLYLRPNPRSRSWLMFAEFNRRFAEGTKPLKVTQIIARRLDL